MIVKRGRPANVIRTCLEENEQPVVAAAAQAYRAAADFPAREAEKRRRALSAAVNFTVEVFPPGEREQTPRTVTTRTP